MNKPSITIKVGNGSKLSWMLFQITLVLLKAFGYIGWNWFLVFFPLWLPFASLIGFFAVMFVLFALYVLFATILGG